MSSRTIEQSSDNEDITIDTNIRVKGFDQSIDFIFILFVNFTVAVIINAVERVWTLVNKPVGTITASNCIVAQSGIDNIVIGRSDYRIVACAGVKLQRDQIGIGNSVIRIRISDTRGINRIIATKCLHDQSVPFFTNTVANQIVAD